MTGVYWGAFDPPTQAHLAIITAVLHQNNIPLQKLIVVVNNHKYKNYTFPLERRMQIIAQIIQSKGLKNIELLWQNETHKLNFQTLKKWLQTPLCAIAGYDAYKKWTDLSSLQERSLYDAIAVIPRGDEPSILFDKTAFILAIDPIYKYVSSTKVKKIFLTHPPISSK